MRVMQKHNRENCTEFPKKHKEQNLKHQSQAWCDHTLLVNQLNKLYYRVFILCQTKQYTGENHRPRPMQQNDYMGVANFG